MAEEQCGGWANRETWAAWLWLVSNEGPRDRVCVLAGDAEMGGGRRRRVAKRLAASIEDFVSGEWPEAERAEEDALARVDWLGIAAAWLDGAADSAP